MRSRGNAPSGIILDQPYLSGLLSKALQGGYAEVTFPSDYTKSILQMARNPAVGQKALEMLLLYDRAYTTIEFDNTDMNSLKKLGLLEVVPRAWAQSTLDEDHARSIKGLILADIRRSGGHVSADDFDRLLPDVNAMFFGTIMSAADAMVPIVRQWLGGDSTGNNDEESHSWAREFPTEGGTARSRTQDEHRQANRIRASYERIVNLIEPSARLNAPVFTNIKKVPRLSVEVARPEAFDRSREIALRIFMKESLSIPRVDTIDDVLSLRKDKRIQHFRAKIAEWAEGLRSGEFGSEEAMRREIREANRAIEDIGKYKRYGMWMTFLSLPLAAVESILQFPISLISVTPLGIGLEIRSKLMERQYSWLMFGR